MMSGVRILAFLLISLAATSACSNGAGKPANEKVDHWLSGPDETSARAGDGTSDLLFKIAKAYDKLRGEFGYADSALKIFDVSHQKWRQQFNMCGNSECRYKLARQELNRLNFTLNRAAMPIPGMPFRSGLFQADADDMSGEVMLFPLDDDRFLMLAVTVRLDKGIETCEHAMAGKLPIRGATLVSEVPEEEYLGADNHVMKLEVRSDRGLMLGPPNDDWSKLPCTPSGKIYGKYSLVQ